MANVFRTGLLLLVINTQVAYIYGQLKPELTLTGHSQGITKLQFSDDGRSLFSAGDFKGSLRTWSIRDGVQTNFLPVGNLYIHAAAMSPDTRYAAGSSQDNQTVLYNVETNTKVATLPTTYRYLSYTPDGKFLITSSGDVINSATGKPASYTLGSLGKFAVSKDSKSVIIGGPLGVSIQSIADSKSKRLFIKYPEGFVLPPYTGGIAVNSTMTKAVIGYYASEGITMVRVVDIPAQKVIATFETPLSAILDVAFSADDNYYAICGDGNLSGGTSGIKVVVYDSQSNRSVLAMPGDDQQRGVHALAFSPDGKYLATGGYSYGGSNNGIFPDIDIKLWPIENYTRRSSVRLPPDDKITKASITNIWAVVVGVSDYTDPAITDLKYAHKDATAYYTFLTSSKGGSIPKDHITLLTDAQATRSNILEALATRFMRAAPQDQIVFYFAGHGQPEYDSNEVLFLTSEAKNTNIEGTTLSQSDLIKALNRSKADKKICIIDACHSGGIGLTGLRSDDAATTNRLIESIAKLEGSVVLTASSRSEKSIEYSELQHGVFTHYLLTGLEGEADLASGKGNSNGSVSMRELYDYLYDKIPKHTKGRQHPQLTGSAENGFPMSVVSK